MSGISKIGIIAGGGDLPDALARHCRSLGIEVFVIGVTGFAQKADVFFRLGQAGRMVSTLKEKGFMDIVLIGSVKRPSLLTLFPDWQTLWFFLKLGFKRCGDDTVLQAARKALEAEGFRLHGAHSLLPDLRSPVGVMGKVSPSIADLESIRIGFEASQELGRADIGQAVLVLGQAVIAQEDKAGTQAMMEQYGQPGAILVKSCKPQQDTDMDLPTIGPDTIAQCAAKRIKGVAVQSSLSLIADKQATIAEADRCGIFLYGIEGKRDA